MLKSGLVQMLSAGVIILFISVNASAVSIGVSPGSIYFSDVLRGGYAEKTIMLSTSSDEPIECDVRAEGSFKDWLSYGSGRTFTLAPKSHFRLKIIVNPPDDVPNGVYEGYITVTVLPKVGPGGGMGSAISTAVSVKCAIEISDEEIPHYKILSISAARYTEERRPMEFSIDLENDGNVRLYPKIHIDILSEDKSDVLKSVEYSEKLILPTTKGNILIIIPNEFPMGKYWGKVTAYINNDVLMERFLEFEVLERGSLRIQGKLLRVGLNKIWVEVDEIVEITAYFKNTGVLVAPAKFKGRVTLGDTVVDIIESEEVEVPVGQTAELTTYFKPTETGRHIIGGEVYFSKKVTHTKSSILNVGGNTVKETEKETATAVPETGGGGVDPIPLIAVFIVLVFIVLIVFFWKRRGVEPVGGKKKEGGLGGV